MTPTGTGSASRIFVLMGLLTLSALPEPVRAAGVEARVEPRLEPATCPLRGRLPAGFAIECRWLRVPQSASDRARGQVDVLVEFVTPEGIGPDAPTRLWVHGGNGAGVKLIERQPAAVAELARGARLVLFDHRGSGFSRPKLECAAFPDPDAALEPGASAAQLAACAAELRDKGIDVNRFGPREAALDLKALRRLLGIERWDVYGVSYGTLVLAYLAAVDGAGIRSVVLDGPSPIDFNARSPEFLLDLVVGMIEDCESDASCRSAFPAIDRDLARAVERLEAAPAEVDGRRVDAVAFMTSLRQALEFEDLRAKAPRAIRAAALGDLMPWSELASRSPDRGRGGADPSFVFTGAACRGERRYYGEQRKGYPPRRPFEAAVVRATRLDVATALDRFCDVLGFRLDTGSAARIASTRVPTLFLIGDLDWQTPYSQALRMRRSFPASEILRFPATGHGVALLAPACAGAVMRSFYADPAASPDTTCVRAIARSPWITGP